jgi:cytochrome c
MSDLTFNKVAGAVLATGLAIVGLRELSAGVFTHPEVEKPGYLVEVAETSEGGGAAAEAPIDWGTVLPAANVAAGEAVFNKCKSCHSIEQGGPNGTGPDIWGVVGRKPGTHGGFAYSSSMVDFGNQNPVWDDEHLSEFLKAPTRYISGTKMTFVGIRNPEERINLIAFLRSKGGTLPIPAPNPAAAAAPEASAPADGAAEGAAAAGEPTATGSTATPAAGSGGPAGQGPGAVSQDSASAANPN